jgi:hypothetical protein
MKKLGYGMGELVRSYLGAEMPSIYTQQSLHSSPTPMSNPPSFQRFEITGAVYPF